MSTSQYQPPIVEGNKSRNNSDGTLVQDGAVYKNEKHQSYNQAGPPVATKASAATPTPALTPAAVPVGSTHDADLVAWLQVLGSFMINLNNFGYANSFGVFQAFYESDLLSTHSPSSISWIGTLQTSLILIVGVVSGPLFDLGFYYPILIGSSIVFVFAVMMLSLSTQYYQVMLTWGVLLGITSGLLYVPSVSMLPLYFKTKHRALAIGLATSGGPIGGVVYPIMVRRVLNEAGFGWACRSLGFVSLATLIIAILLIKPSTAAEKKPVRKLFDISAVKDRPFIVFVVTGFFLWLGFLVPFILTPIYGLQGLNPPVSENLAYYLLAVPNAAQFFGRIIPAIMVDAKLVGVELVLLISLIVSAVLLLCWIAVSNLGGFIVILIFYGFFCGSMTTLPAVLIPYLCPSLAVIGTRIGMVYAASGLGALIGPPVALAASDVATKIGPRAFLGAQLWAGLTMFGAVLLFCYTALAVRRKRLALEAKMRAAAAEATVADKA